MSNKVVELIINNQLTTKINDKLRETSIDNNSVINFKSKNLEIENQNEEIDDYHKKHYFLRKNICFKITN